MWKTGKLLRFKADGNHYRLLFCTCSQINVLGSSYSSYFELILVSHISLVTLTW
jgi:hypothetical protein